MRWWGLCWSCHGRGVSDVQVSVSLSLFRDCPSFSRKQLRQQGPNKLHTSQAHPMSPLFYSFRSPDPSGPSMDVADLCTCMFIYKREGRPEPASLACTSKPLCLPECADEEERTWTTTFYDPADKPRRPTQCTGGNPVGNVTRSCYLPLIVFPSSPLSLSLALCAPTFKLFTPLPASVFQFKKRGGEITI